MLDFLMSLKILFSKFGNYYLNFILSYTKAYCYQLKNIYFNYFHETTEGRYY